MTHISPTAEGNGAGDRSEQGSDGMTPGEALGRAWVVYLGLIGLLLVMAVGVTWYLFAAVDDYRPAVEGGMPGFYIGCVLLAVAMAGFFVRRTYFAEYYEGRRVGPGDYLKGVLWTWLPIAGAVLASLIFAAVFRRAIPELIPALVGTVLLFIFFPNGRSMVLPVGATDDPASYEEPK